MLNVSYKYKIGWGIIHSSHLSHSSLLSWLGLHTRSNTHVGKKRTRLEDVEGRRKEHADLFECVDQVWLGLQQGVLTSVDQALTFLECSFGVVVSPRQATDFGTQTETFWPLVWPVLTGLVCGSRLTAFDWVFQTISGLPLLVVGGLVD